MKAMILKNLLAGLGMLVLAACAWGAESVPKADERLKINLVLYMSDASASVGDTVSADIVIENTTSAPLMVLNWDKWHDVLWLVVEVKEYPGEEGNPGVFLRGMPWGREIGAVRLSENRELPPGKTVLRKEITFMMPGKATVDAGLMNDSHYVRVENKRDGQPLDNAWMGEVVSKKVVTVSGEMAPSMKARYDDAKKRLLAPGTSDVERLKILADVAAEKHYFAARFIRGACEFLPKGEARDAAIGHLVELAKFGTAYESVPYLVKTLSDEDVPSKTRQVLLDWLGKLLMGRGFDKLAMQAGYRYPVQVLEGARAAIQSLSTGRDPYLAAQAREILKTIEAKEKEAKEAQAKQAVPPAPSSAPPAAPKASPPK